jgi:hypothetical protein
VGIENIDFLKQDDTSACPNTRRDVSQHIVHDEQYKFVFGWDQPLQSFYLQKHDSTQSEEEQIIAWLGATAETKMYEVEDLVHAAAKHGLRIDHQMRVKLYGEKDDGR